MAKYKNDEEYRVVLKSIHPDFESVSFYIDDSVKMKFRCLICGYEWEALPCDVLFVEYKCEECFRKEKGNKRTTSFVTFLKRLREVHHGLIEYVGGYVDMSTKCFLRCTICGLVWKAYPSNVIHQGCGCPDCGHRRCGEKNKRSIEDVLVELESKYPGMFEYIGGYSKLQAKCWWRCKICGHVWEAQPHNLLHGTQCPACSRMKQKERMAIPLDEVRKRIWIISNGTIVYVSDYVNTHTKSKWMCLKCGHVWDVCATNLLQGFGCPNCQRLNMILPLDEVKERVRIISNGTLEYVSGYEGTMKKCKWRCLICNTEFEITPDKLFIGQGCPRCRSSKLEKPIYDLLSKKLKVNIDFKFNKRLEDCILEDSDCPLRPDFLFLKYKLAFELDGIQHHIPRNGEVLFAFTQKSDAFKNQYFKEKGYILIRVASDASLKYTDNRWITLDKLKELINAGISDNGEVNLDVFRPYDFNRII